MIQVVLFFLSLSEGIGKLEPMNMVIGMVGNTKCIPKEIVKNLLIRIDKFILPINFVILDIIEDIGTPFILGRPLLATAHAEVGIFRKTIYLEVGNEKVLFKMRSNISDNIHESVRMIKTKINAKEDELMKNDSDLFTYNTNSCEINHLLSIDPDVFTYDIEVQELYEEIVYRFGEVSETAREKILRDHWRKRFRNEYDDSEDFKDPDGCEEREVYTKKKVSELEELSRTRGNIANIRAGIMEEILGNDDEKESYDET
ncbi:zinc knuckle CX2CX4HX4C containing protein [Tanacetum coccineum]